MSTEQWIFVIVVSASKFIVVFGVLMFIWIKLSEKNNRKD